MHQAATTQATATDRCKAGHPEQRTEAGLMTEEGTELMLPYTNSALRQSSLSISQFLVISRIYTCTGTYFVLLPGTSHR